MFALIFETVVVLVFHLIFFLIDFSPSYRTSICLSPVPPTCLIFLSPHLSLSPSASLAISLCLSLSLSLSLSFTITCLCLYMQFICTKQKLILLLQGFWNIQSFCTVLIINSEWELMELKLWFFNFYNQSWTSTLLWRELLHFLAKYC